MSRLYDKAIKELHQYDGMNDMQPMIRFAKGCQRSINYDETVIFIDAMPHMGVIKCGAEYRDAVYEALGFYRRFYVANLLHAVYGLEFSPDDVDDLTDEEVEELYERFTPSNFEWIMNDDSVLDFDAPTSRKMSRAINNMVFGRKDQREATFHFDEDTKEFDPRYID
ncbi:MAG: hypothetical protein Q4C83_03510 [Candidatus Saccharibacteria bacterium]|nr:hypothetical protein [Candidatus Saccharibacteria bacterium]